MKLPFFEELEAAGRVLIAGAGGGFDVFSGLPLYFALRGIGKDVFLANLSFSSLAPDAGRYLTPTLVEVTADSNGYEHYFPEKYLSQWFRERGEAIPIYCFHRTGAAPVARGYAALVTELRVDTVILVDGGTDSLMRGDEEGLGTPQEDMASIAAVAGLDDSIIRRKMLVCLGFGIDAFHGVCHAHVLEAIADILAAGGYLGAMSLTIDMPEVRQFRDATRFVLERTPGRESIVLSSILSALEGRFGDHHATERTDGSELFINPLMALYWCFRLPVVAGRILYLDWISRTEEYFELTSAIRAFHASITAVRPTREIPV